MWEKSQIQLCDFTFNEKDEITSSKDSKSNTGAVLLLWPDGSEKGNLHQVSVKEIPSFHTEDTT